MFQNVTTGRLVRCVTSRVTVVTACRVTNVVVSVTKPAIVAGVKKIVRNVSHLCLNAKNGQFCDVNSLLLVADIPQDNAAVALCSIC